MHSILVLISDTSYREKVCGEIVRGVRCPVYTAADVTAGLSLVQAEKPTILITTSEFADLHGKKIAEVVAALSPDTALLFLADNARAARAAT